MHRTLVSAKGPLPPGPLRLISHRRWHAAVSLRRGLGADERPDLYVDWPHHPLSLAGEGRLGLLCGRYDERAHRLRNPTYAPLTVPEAVKLSAQVAELMAQEDAQWGRRAVGSRLDELVRPAVIPGAGTLKGILEQLAAPRPALLLTLAAIQRRHPELVAAARDRVAAAVSPVLRGLDATDRAGHAAEAAHAAWTFLGDRDAALALLEDWRAPADAVRVNHPGAEALALAPELALAHLRRLGTGSPAAVAFARRHLLVPLAAELDLATAVPLPGAFADGRPVLEPAALAGPADHARDALLVAQFGGWARIGPARVTCSARAGVDRMPTVGRRRADPRGVQAALHVVNPAARPVSLEVADAVVAHPPGRPTAVPVLERLPTTLPAAAALTVPLGVLGGGRLDPRAPFRVELTVRVDGHEYRFEIAGQVAVAH